MNEIPEIEYIKGPKTKEVNYRSKEGYKTELAATILGHTAGTEIEKSPSGIDFTLPSGAIATFSAHAYETIRRRYHNIDDIDTAIAIPRNFTVSEGDEENHFGFIEALEDYRHAKWYPNIETRMNTPKTEYGDGVAFFMLAIIENLDVIHYFVAEHMLDSPREVEEWIHDRWLHTGKTPTTNPSYSFLLGGYPVIVSLAREDLNRVIVKTIYEYGGVMPNNTFHIDYKVE